MSNEEIEAMQMRWRPRPRQEGQVRHPRRSRRPWTTTRVHQFDADGLAGAGGPFPARLRPDRPRHARRTPRPQPVDAAGTDDAQWQADQRGRPQSARWSRSIALDGPKADVDQAISLAYREILTRGAEARGDGRGEGDRRRRYHRRWTAWPTCGGRCSTATSSVICRERW